MIMKKQKPPSPLFIINNGELKEVSCALVCGAPLALHSSMERLAISVCTWCFYITWPENLLALILDIFIVYIIFNIS